MYVYNTLMYVPWCDKVWYLFGIDPGIQSNISDQVDDPLLCLLRGHVQFSSQHAVVVLYIHK